MQQSKLPNKLSTQHSNTAWNAVAKEQIQTPNEEKYMKNLRVSIFGDKQDCQAVHDWGVEMLDFYRSKNATKE